MKDVVVIGAGKIGGAIALMLAETGDYNVVVTDRDQAQLNKLDKHPGISGKVVDITENAAIVALLRGKFAVLSAAPFNLTGKVAEAALEASVHYLDLTEDVATTKKVEELSEGADVAFIPQCGLAPGFISIVANELAKRFDTLDSVRMRVGALPQYPSNALNYNLTWSTDGLINEYIEPCEAIVEGKFITVPAMEEREEFSLDGVTYEAFNTSGGLGTLAKTLEGRVRTMNYRTIRYPGHQAIIKALLNDLNLKNRRDVLKDLFENALPATMQDVVVIFVTVCGWKDGRYMQETYANKVYSGVVAGKTMSAIQITTAAGITTVLDLLADGKLPQKGFVRQEEVALADFLNNRFGRVYDPEAIRLKKAV
ncbi:saccharopine dehydrogenase family protein [Mesorhizobium sp. M8A.F.Ca.ET.208.01.1.1]|uniref:saccharopine dehydrogenase family protein n=1 Tax=unclassified Mesorhizobium TaxID=325217 RepID=UPI000F74D698|nr:MULTISPECIES: saccharopine dehydrogenase family protein [unclassified Mesorhizobium]RUX03626.1 saccharopine dehydrogenase family protein [Mesorhizobium sp. M8A.F.Ca.ET.059.01.1.1]AZO54373.1 saccharopine dehydrogenase family protein [Mesorhizobium sp. M8A.F.Ca.ET.057.01.1.1]RWE49815.1 MAG: saccharopine dehydrogenase family protein [Mesorhizobium sp.]TGQ94545.1 saccharopine dehydrogenase family protein [Mesorhizobium sp. M8A.F.Ca.ET.208.01.1.1]TGT55033.1 saccharopine dehydrogenase family prot